MFKQTLKTLGVFILAVALFSCKSKPSSQEAITYNDKIVAIQANAINSVEEVITAFEGTSEDLQNAYKGAVAKATQALDDVKKLGPLEAENTAFYDAAVKYLTMHKQVLETEYKDVIDVISNEQAGEAEIAALENKLKDTDDKYAKADEEFEKAQITFSKEYGFRIAQ